MRIPCSPLMVAVAIAAPAVAAAPASAQDGGQAGPQPVAFAADLAGATTYAPVPVAPLAALAPQTPSQPQLMSDADLDSARGGFMTAAGVTFGFGVVVRSYVSDQLALQTQLTWTSSGAKTQQTYYGAPGVMDLASAMAALFASGIDLRNLNTTGGFALIDADGATAILHNITSSQMQNLIINNADNRHIRQDMELNLVLPDLARIQADSRSYSYGAHISRDIDWAGLRSVGF